MKHFVVTNGNLKITGQCQTRAYEADFEYGLSYLAVIIVTNSGKEGKSSSRNCNGNKM